MSSHPVSSNDSLTCRYPSKRCGNSRTKKRNGELHSLCELHRSKANRNQRRMEKRRRMTKRMQQEQPGQGSPTANMRMVILKKTVFVNSNTSLPTETQMTAYVVPSVLFTDLLLSDLTATTSSPPTSPCQLNPSPLLNIKVPQDATELFNDVLESNMDAFFKCMESIPASMNSENTTTFAHAIEMDETKMQQFLDECAVEPVEIDDDSYSLYNDESMQMRSEGAQVCIM